MTPEETYRQATLRGIPMLWLMQDRPANRPGGRSKARTPWGGIGLALFVSLWLLWLFY